MAIMFLSGLHMPSTPTRLSERSMGVLRSVHNRMPKQGFSQLTDDSWKLADVCRLFEDIGLQVEILSLFEKEKTRLKVKTG